MKVNIENPSSTECRCVLIIPASEVNTIINKSISSFSKDLTLDGYRKGKIPSQVIEERFSKDIAERATACLLEEKSKLALEEKGITPITGLHFEVEKSAHVKRDQEFSFSFIFEVLPFIKLPQEIETISVNITEPMINPGEMNTILTNIQKNFARLEEIGEERFPEENEVVLVDIQARYEDEIISGMTGKNLHIQIKKKSLMPEIDKLLRTMKANEEIENSLITLNTYPDPRFREKDVSVNIQLHKIYKEVLPEINDDFAKEAGFENLTKMQNDLFFKTMNNKALTNKAIAQNSLINKFLEGQDFCIPKSLISNEFNRLMNEIAASLQAKGLDKKSIQTSLKNMHEQNLEQAKQKARAQSFLMAFAQQEKLGITDKEIANFIQQTAKQNNQDAKKLYEQFFRNGMLRDIKNQLLAKKALEVLFSKVKKNVVDMQGKSVEVIL